jgi:hypothetical protein
MQNLRLREVATDQTLHSRPGPSRSPLLTEMKASPGSAAGFGTGTSSRVSTKLRYPNPRLTEPDAFFDES